MIREKVQLNVTPLCAASSSCWRELIYSTNNRVELFLKLFLTIFQTFGFYKKWLKYEF